MNIFGMSNKSSRPITYRANAGEIRLWAKMVDSIGMQHNAVVLLYEASSGSLMPHIPIPNTQKFIDEYNQLMEQTLESETQEESPIPDIIDQLENGELD